jgi:hypothetical protein
MPVSPSPRSELGFLRVLVDDEFIWRADSRPLNGQTAHFGRHLKSD